jgi:hypothetical protein
MKVEFSGNGWSILKRIDFKFDTMQKLSHLALFIFLSLLSQRLRPFSGSPAESGEFLSTH